MQILSDVFDVSARLKEIDSRYTLHYDPRRGKFELRGKDGVLLLTYPFESMDARMVELALRTRVERSNELVREMDEHNRKIEEARERESAEYQMESLKEIAEKHYATEGKRYY